jgi:N4-gp56 family major capsid protein
MGLLREMIKYGVLKGCTNAFYSGGTSRATVDEKVTVNLLARMTRNLQANRAGMITSVLAPSTNYDTSAIQAGYLVFAHTDLEYDIENLPGYVPSSKYGSKKLAHPDELGSVGRYRFVLSPELAPYADAGAAIAGTDLLSTTGTSADVYPLIVVGEDAWGDVALRGSKSFDMTFIPHTVKEKSDPHGQRGYVGAQFWSAAVITNGGHMAVGEVAITSL